MAISAKTRTSVISVGGLGVAVVVLLLTVAHSIPFKEVRISMCPISGSREVVTRWFGLWARVEVKETALELWIRRREPTFRPQWKRLSTNTHYVLARGFGCSPAPPIYTLQPLMQHVTNKLSDERIAELVDVMRTGTREEQQEFLKKIEDEIFESLEAEARL
jgi:hypothetical protein